MVELKVFIKSWRERDGRKNRDFKPNIDSPALSGWNNNNEERTKWIIGVLRNALNLGNGNDEKLKGLFSTLELIYRY